MSHVLGKIEPVEREGDGGTQLLFEPITLREPLEVDDENLGQPVEGVPLRAAPSRLASLARRHLVPVENLLLGERVEAVEKRNFARPGGDPQAQIPERLEGDRLVGTFRTSQGRLELANEEVDQLGIVATYVALPRLHSLLAHAEAAVNLAVDGGGLGEHPVDVLVEPFQQVAEELLAVLLVVPAEPRCEPDQSRCYSIRLPLI